MEGGTRGRAEVSRPDTTVQAPFRGDDPVAGHLSREALEVVVQSIGEGIIVQDPTGTLLYANDAAARLIGFPSARALLEVTVEELTERFEILDEEGSPLDAADLPSRRALLGETVSDVVIRFRRAGASEERSSLVSSAPVTDETGRVRFVVNVFRDITEAKRAEKRLVLLARAGEVLSSSLDYEVTMQRLAELVTPALADWFSVEMLDDQGNLVNVIVGHADPAKVEWAKRFRERYPPDPTDPEGLGRVLSTGASVLYREIPPGALEGAARDPEHMELLLELGLRSVMIVPLRAGERILGAISFVSSRPQLEFGPEDLALAEELARRAGMAIENARLHQAERSTRRTAQRAAGRMTRLQAVTAKLADALDLSAIARVVVEEGLEALGASGGAMLAMSAEGDALELIEPAGYDAGVVSAYRRLRLDAGLPVADAARLGRPVYLASRAEALERYAEVAASSANQAWAALPLDVKGRVLGVLALSFAEERPFGRADRSFLNAIAHQAAGALERARLYAAEQEARARAETLSVRLLHLEAISRAGLTHLDLQDLLDDLLVRIKSILSADRAVILLREGDVLRVRAAIGVEADVAAGVRVPLGRGVAGTIAAQGAPLVLEQVAAMNPVSSYLREQAVALAGVPLLLEGSVIGVLEVSTDTPRRFRPEEVSLLELVAARAALAINQAQVYERERNVSETLQRSLLPERLPRVEGLELAARYIPGGRALTVGGDWYDAIPVPGDGVVLVVGDVVGHGLQAAAFMGQLRYALRAYALEGHSPSTILGQLDRTLHTLEGEALATVMCLCVDVRTGEVLYANAGHPPALLATPGVEPRFLTGGRGVPLGAMEGSEFQEATATAPAGSTLFLFTDGLIESRDLPIDEGMDRLVQVVRDGTGTVDELAATVVERATGGDVVEDDVALLVARITGAAMPC